MSLSRKELEEAMIKTMEEIEQLSREILATTNSRDKEKLKKKKKELQYLQFWQYYYYKNTYV